MMTPRSIPFAMAIKLLFFANVNTFVALVFLLVGLGFGCMMWGPCAADHVGNWKPSGEAIVSSIKSTSTTVNGESVLAYQFSGKAADGVDIDGTSYQFRKKFEVGQTVPLEKCQFLGEKWRLNDAAFSILGTAPLFMSGICFVVSLLFGVTAFALWFFGVFLRGLRRLRLMRYGEIEKAEFVDSEKVNNVKIKNININLTGGVQVNMRMLVKMTFQFVADDKQTYPAIVYTTWPKVVLPEASEKLTVFYGSDAPEKNFIPRTFKGMDFDAQKEALTYAFWRLLPDLLVALLVTSLVGAVFMLALKSLQNGLVFGYL